MMRIDGGPLIWLLFFGLAIGFLVIVPEDSAAVDRPTEPGPYTVGYFDVTLNVTEYDYTLMVDCRYYYPATSNSEWANPDASGAPYPPIIYHIFLASDPVATDNRTKERDQIEFLASHGFVVVTFTPWRADIAWFTDNESFLSYSFYNDLIYHTDMYDINTSSPLYGMVDKERYGTFGEYFSGAICFVHGCLTDKITAVHSWAPYFLQNYVPDIHRPTIDSWNAKDRAWMIQKSENLWFDGFIESNYEPIGPDKIMVTIPGGATRGPYRMDLMVVFFQYYLGGIDEYETYLFGEEAEKEILSGQYLMKYDITDKTGPKVAEYDAPVFTLDLPSSINMDDQVLLGVNWDRKILLDDPTLVHEWYVGDTAEPYVTSYTGPNVTVRFTQPGEYDYISYKYKIGRLEVWSDIGSIVVRNVWPVANAGQDTTIAQDDRFELDGSASWDTPSDIDSLEYNWSGPGITSSWSTDPTLVIDTRNMTTFTASLIVRDRHGKVSSSPDSVMIKIINRLPTAFLGTEIASDEDELVVLTGVGNDSTTDVDRLSYKWDFGDGISTGWSNENSTNHTYESEGAYTVTFHVRDPNGATNSTTMSITVNNVAPRARIDHPQDGSTGDIDTKIRFVGWGIDTPSDNGSLWYTWDFGDERTADGPEVSHTFDEPGNYEVTLAVEDDDGASAVFTLTLTIEDVGPPVDDPIVFTVTVGFLAMVLIALVAITEPGKYWIGLLGSPMFTKVEDVLDNKTRHALLGVIVTSPGIHYSAIKEEFGLANGQAAYHLDVLERESFIRSVRDGKLKRFYSSHTKVPEDVGMSPEQTRDSIVGMVRRKPGINQLEIMEELGLTRDAASYYLRDLVKQGSLKAEREGKYTVYHVKG